MRTILDLDLLGIAHARLHLAIATSIVLVAIIAWMIGLFNSGGQPDILLIVANIVLGLLGIWVVVAGIILQIKMGIGVPTIVLTAILAFVLPWLVGLALVSQASTVLKLAGAKPGLLGTPQSELDKITPGHCRGCGYSREGIGLLDPCPECTRVPQVI